MHPIRLYNSFMEAVRYEMRYQHADAVVYLNRIQFSNIPSNRRAIYKIKLRKVREALIAGETNYTTAWVVSTALAQLILNSKRNEKSKQSSK